MNSHVRHLLRPLGSLLCCVTFGSCGDDPEMVRKREEQKVEISRLDGELAMLGEKLDQVPPDRSAEVSQLKRDAIANQTQIEQLESEIDTLERQKADIEKQHAAYRRKYVVR